MKKIFLFTSALLVSATMMAQLVGWSAVEINNETLDGSASVEHVYTNEQNDIFFIGNAGSNGEQPSVSFNGTTLSTAPYRVRAKTTNANLIFGKASSEDATNKWFGASDRGAFTSYVATPTSDGKLIMALTAYHTDSNYLADNKVMSFNLLTADGTTAGGDLEAPYAPIVSGKSTKFIQFGSIVEVSDKGLAFVQNFEQMTGQSAGFSFADIATDGTNYYVLAILKPGIVVGEKDTIKANVAAGSAAILKFNDKWQLVDSIISDGLVNNSTSQVLKYVDGKLYYACNVAGKANSEFILGDKSLTTTANAGVAVATLSTDLQCESLTWIKTCPAAGKSGNMTLKDILLNGTNAYLTGFYAGGIAWGENDTIATSTNAAFITKMDLTTGNLIGATRLSANAITQGVSLLSHNDSIYLYANNWEKQTGRIALYSYDLQLNAGDTIKLVDAAEMEAVTSAAFTNNGLVAYGFRTKMSITFTADDQATYTSPNDKAFQGLFAVQQLFENPEQAIDNTFAPAQKAEKFIRNGQLYIRRGEHIFNALGQQL